MKRAAIWLVAASALAVLPPAGAAPPSGDRPIQPGARITHPLTEPFGNRLPFKFRRCTLSFVFRDARKRLYIGTTGEPDCVGAIGERVYDENGKAFGTGVFRECASGAGTLAVIQACGPHATSFSLIRIDRARYGDVSPAVRHWGGPTGVMAVGKARPGAMVLFTGGGWVAGDLPQTAPRFGVLISYDWKRFTADTLAGLSDSGAPLIDRATGRAIGIISDFGLTEVPPVTDDGPSILAILADCAKAGFRLRLVTAPYAAPF
jgi:hypothetical protein